jgi:hypothetical protein
MRQKRHRPRDFNSRSSLSSMFNPQVGTGKYQMWSLCLETETSCRGPTFSLTTSMVEPYRQRTEPFADSRSEDVRALRWKSCSARRRARPDAAAQHKGDYVEASEYFTHSLKIEAANKNKIGISHSLHQLGGNGDIGDYTCEVATTLSCGVTTISDKWPKPLAACQPK